MGCTLNYTGSDHTQAMKSIGRFINEPPATTLTRERRHQIRAALHRTSARTLLKILSNPGGHAYAAIKDLLVKSVPSEMTDTEKQALPEAFRIVLNKQPDAMGIFEKAPSHIAPGQSSIQHHYEILSSAAMISRPFKAVSGRSIMVSPADRIDFGIKMSAGYAQPKRHGTIEADFLVNRVNGRVAGFDAKYSKNGKYYGKTSDLERQLKGIRTGFRDAKIDEFVFVTNREFGDKFHVKVQQINLEIAKDSVKMIKMVYKNVPPELLTSREQENIFSGKQKPDLSRPSKETKEFIEKYNIPQIELCEHVKFPGT